MKTSRTGGRDELGHDGMDQLNGGDPMNRTNSLTLFTSVPAPLLRVVSLFVALGLSFTSSAAIIMVDTTLDTIADDGQCALREAVISANSDTASGLTAGECPAGAGADHIVLLPGTYTLTILGVGEDVAATGDLDITNDVMIVGSGRATTIIDEPSTDNLAADRVFEIHAGTVVQIAGVTIQNGGGLTLGGGGISNQGTLMLSDSELRNNGANGGGAIWNDGALTIDLSTVRSNGAIGSAGGIWNHSGTLTVQRSLIIGNSSTFGGNGILNEDRLIVTSTTITGNVGLGAAVQNSPAGDATLINVTISANRAGFPVGSGIHNQGTLRLRSSTVSRNGDNVAAPGPAILSFSTATLDLENTIVADNVGGDCDAPVNSLGHNLDSDGSCGLMSLGDLSNTNPFIDALLDNGGPTPTQGLSPGSPAIDAGNDATCPANDQRGVVRPQGDGCDIGAVEVRDEDLIDSLAGDVESLGPTGSGSLDAGQENSLLSQLAAAENSAARGSTRAACSQLRAFINHVTAFVSAGVLTVAEGDRLIDDAERIRIRLGCNS